MSDEQMEREVSAVGAVKKPWWFLVVVLALVGGTAFAASRVVAELGWHPDAAPLSGLVGGLLLAITVLGHLPGKYRDARTGEYKTFWSPQSRGVRIRCAVVAAVVLVVGVMIDHP